MTTLTNRYLTSLVSILAIVGLTTGCGGGGGGSFEGAALVNIDASPNRIDSGDRMDVTVRFDEVNENGIILKLRYPTALSYISNTSTIEINGASRTVNPAFNAAASDGFAYLVFFLPAGVFGDTDNGVFTVSLRGVAAVADSAVEVDPDIYDPGASNASQFSLTDPLFSAEDSIKVTVEG